MKRKTILDLIEKKGKDKLVCLTAYTSPFAQILDKYVDILLVGDSLGMVLYGMENTLGVTMNMMYSHGKAVVNSSENALIIVDMPFASYQESMEKAFRNASIIMKKTGCTAVKLEGGKIMADTIRFLVNRGIPVAAHVGLKPQHVHSDGGYRLHGKTDEERKNITEDAIAVEKAGAFMIVLENIDSSLAAEITDRISIPTIGIGSGSRCDGQILVTEDMCGLLGENVPNFVKIYANMKKDLEKSVYNFCNEVRTGNFP